MNNKVQQGLEQDAQFIVERNPTMENNQAVELLKRFFAENPGLTQADLARKLGVSSTQFNHFFHGKYKADTAELSAKVIQFINDFSRRERRVRSGYVETKVARHIHTLITSVKTYSEREGKIGVIIGDSGHGKSTCLEKWSETHPNSIYLSLRDNMTSASMFAAIARKLTSFHIDDSGGLARLTENIITKLRDRDMIIILDESSGLTVGRLNQLRQVIVIECRCPLILAGNSYLLGTINLPTTRRGCESLDQFRSRILCTLNLDKLAESRPAGGDNPAREELYSFEELRKIYQYGGIRLAKDALAALRAICRSRQSGRLHICTLLVEALHTAADIQKAGIITAQDIADAIWDLGLPDEKLPVQVTAGKPAAAEEEEEPLAATA